MKKLVISTPYEYLINLILIFFFISFLGWIIETVYRSIKEKRFVNAGFLYGPFVPIYGFGALFVYFIEVYCENLPIYSKIILFFFISSVVEYTASHIMEKLLGTRLWDYSKEKFNLDGRICLKFSIYWTIFCISGIYTLKPLIFYLLNTIEIKLKFFIAGVLLGYIIIDFSLSTKLYKSIVELINMPSSTLSNIFDALSFKKNENHMLPLFIKKISRPLVTFPELLNKLLNNIKEIPSVLIEEIKKTGKDK